MTCDITIVIRRNIEFLKTEKIITKKNKQKYKKIISKGWQLKNYDNTLMLNLFNHPKRYHPSYFKH